MNECAKDRQKQPRSLKKQHHEQAVPALSPPASRPWDATPESPYWSLEWADTHFLWARATDRQWKSILGGEAWRVGQGETDGDFEVLMGKGRWVSKNKQTKNKALKEDISHAEACLVTKIVNEWHKLMEKQSEKK